MKELKNRGIPYKIYLSEDEMPRYWYNVRADMKNKPAPLLNPGTLQPMTAEELGHVFCDELVKQELLEMGVRAEQFISINFEDMSYSHLQTAQALHDEITKRAKEIGGKVYLFFDEIQEVKDWEKCINSLRVSLDCDI